jgi:hypothetical protein
VAGHIPGTASLPGSFTPGLHVDPQLAGRDKQELLVTQLEMLRGGLGPRIQGTTSHMQGFAEVVVGGVGIQVGPQQVNDLRPMEAMVRRQGQQLDQALSLSQAPLRLIDGLAACGDGESAKELNPQVLIGLLAG